MQDAVGTTELRVVSLSSLSWLAEALFNKLLKVNTRSERLRSRSVGLAYDHVKQGM